MPENVVNWWRRRQLSKGMEVPYPIGTYRSEWERFPVLVRQFHPDLNGFVTLTQIPPAADVYLLWVCESGHRVVATPAEQRDRPGRSRRRSTWCPECTRLALNRPVRPRPEAVPATDQPPEGESAAVRPPSESRRLPHRSPPRPHRQRIPVGTAFFSERAPRPSSAAEADLRRRIADRLDVDLTLNAVRVRSAFHDRFEVWPDLVIPELMIAIEYDTTGRSATEHVGSREAGDRRKDQLLRHTGWEVVRIRTSKLAPLGPFDIVASGVTGAVVDRLIDRMGEIRGQLIVSAYLRPPRRQAESIGPAATRRTRDGVVPDMGLEPIRP